ncbi:hypothetical protein JCM3765_007789 [Sporobolomyces pararoseus]
MVPVPSLLSLEKPLSPAPNHIQHPPPPSWSSLNPKSSDPPTPYPLPPRSSSLNDKSKDLQDSETEYFASLSNLHPRSTSHNSHNSSNSFSSSTSSTSRPIDRSVIRRSSESSTAHTNTHFEGAPAEEGGNEVLALDSFFEQERKNAAMERLANLYRRQGMGEIEDWSKSCWPGGPTVGGEKEEKEKPVEKRRATSSVHFRNERRDTEERVDV